MADSDVQLPPNSTGPLVDTAQVTTGAGTVQRQRVAIGDNVVGGAVAAVGLDSSLHISDALGDAILLELRRIARGLEMLIGDTIPTDDLV